MQDVGGHRIEDDRDSGLICLAMEHRVRHCLAQDVDDAGAQESVSSQDLGGRVANCGLDSTNALKGSAHALDRSIKPDHLVIGLVQDIETSEQITAH
jgi:hypothetical protein